MDKFLEVQFNKFFEVELLMEEFGLDYDTAFDVVYGLFGDPEETDDAIKSEVYFL